MAADPLFTLSLHRRQRRPGASSSPTTPSMHSSQNEQDNRHYARARQAPHARAFRLARRPRTSSRWPSSCQRAIRHARSCSAPPPGSATARAWSSRASARNCRPPSAWSRTPAKWVMLPPIARGRHPARRGAHGRSWRSQAETFAVEPHRAGRHEDRHHHHRRGLPVRPRGLPQRAASSSSGLA
ncbi:MAG: hypothetical protein MZU79_02870 [Anaerotruncus sp.]|nr:hypothetical protein [Anaerotruncus sp.]